MKLYMDNDFSLQFYFRIQDDILINRPSKKHLELYDRDLKNFRISKALDRVLEVSEGVCVCVCVCVCD